MPSLLFSFFPLLSSPYSLSPTWQLPQFFQVTQILVFAFFMCFLLDDITIFKYRWRRNWPITLLIKHIDASITVYSHSQVIGMIHQDCRVGKVNVFFFQCFSVNMNAGILWVWRTLDGHSLITITELLCSRQLFHVWTRRPI
jgi:hypothetical protein